jgi:5-deoxy-glucuronate isomerase
MSTGQDNAAWVHPRGSLAAPGWEVDLTDGIAGWQHAGLLVATLTPGEVREVELAGREAIVIPLAGGVHVRAERSGRVDEASLAGRESVWSGPSDVVYVPTGSHLTLTGTDCSTGTGTGTGRIAVALAADQSGTQPPAFRHLPASEVPIELRGAGIASRQVRNFGVPGVLDANRLIACEVITPAGNWSSWPPHKHDTECADVESELEEIYYVETRSTDPRGTDPLGLLRVYAAGERPIDVLTEVRTGDVVLVPHGWHGPAVAAPDADLYYLNVMAGPGPQRAWLICDDPAHAWVRDTWPTLPVDPRLS